MQRGRGRSPDKVRGWPRHRGAHRLAAEKACGNELARPLKDRKNLRPNATEACHPTIQDGSCRRIRKGWPCGNHGFREYRSLASGLHSVAEYPGWSRAPASHVGWSTRRAHVYARMGSATRAMTRQRRIAILPDLTQPPLSRSWIAGRRIRRSHARSGGSSGPPECVTGANRTMKQSGSHRKPCLARNAAMP